MKHVKKVSRPAYGQDFEWLWTAGSLAAISTLFLGKKAAPL
mgnify:FL=1